MNTPAIIYTYSASSSAPEKVYGPFPSIASAIDWATINLGPETDELRWDATTLLSTEDHLREQNQELKGALALCRREIWTLRSQLEKARTEAPAVTL